jgi:predicted DNA-binding transcriptional regulator YafY
MRDDPLLGYEAPIEYDHTHKAYFYTDKTYTIRAFGLKDQDITALMFYAKTLNQYKEYEVFKDFENAIEKVLDAVTIRKGIRTVEQARLVVQTENTSKLLGSELIPKIIQALDENRVIEFIYQRFDDSIQKNVKLHPYLLKEDRHIWYIIGKHTKKEDPVTTYALDRMKSIKLLDTRFQPITFDFDEYYRYSFGITVTSNDPIEVVLSFTPLQGKYLKSLPIHSTQKILVDDDNEYRISVIVKPSWEFYEKLLGYGEAVKVIAPQSIKDEMRRKLTTILSFY